MQTAFTEAQRRDPDIAEADAILRACVHCGFCTATCPTYLELGEENDSPRGRIYLAKTLLEGAAEDATVVARHLDRCLTCLSCMTTCPSGVDYVHLLDIARARLARAPQARPWHRRLVHTLLDTVVPHPQRFARMLALSRLFRPLLPIVKRMGADHAAFAPFLRMWQAAAKAPKAPDSPMRGVFPARGKSRGQVALLAGCAQSVLAGRIDRASIRLLNRLGWDVVIPEQSGCCGALSLHLGHRARAESFARANIAAWEDADVSAVLINASGCGAVVKDYGHLLVRDSAWASRARAIAEKTKDLSEWLAEQDWPEAWKAPADAPPLILHQPCSLQHGQRITCEPAGILTRAGFDVHLPEEPHICCGAAGFYTITEPEIADRLGRRKAGHLKTAARKAAGTSPQAHNIPQDAHEEGAALDAPRSAACAPGQAPLSARALIFGEKGGNKPEALVVSANFSCMDHLTRHTTLPVLHYAEILEALSH
ncbi:glycolate oxidase subunit GlcF [Thermopetrobacter sp. TC1]|uniref:glycolate oxidase subunit GlcF n=1 Tax=Thermopetrobacter sp. TC1 TaxID=1495045 RepID=UPI00068BC4A4|nr:glycolate oxidase subunit GlcF [Thermopetrobacter sp. TC1]